MLQQYHLGNTYYGYDPNTGQLIPFGNMSQLLQYFPQGIDQNAPTLPSNVNPNTNGAMPLTVQPANPGSLGPSPTALQGNTPPNQPSKPSSTTSVTNPPSPQVPTFYQPNPGSPKVFDAQGNLVSLDQYQQLTNQTGVPSDSLNWSFVKQTNPPNIGATTPSGATGTTSTTPPVNPNDVEFTRGEQFFVMPSTHGQTVYLFDKNSNIYIPFTSPNAFQAFTGTTIQQAQANGEIQNLTQLGPGTVVSDANGIGDNGQLQNLSSITTNFPSTTNQQGSTSPTGASSGTNTYGQTDNPELDNQVSQDLGQMFTSMLNTGDIDQSTFDQTINNPTNHAEYISALAYGGYSFGDVYSDAKAKQLNLNSPAISTTQTAQQYYPTTQYQQVKNNQQLQPPTNLGYDSSFFNNPIFQIPAAAFQTPSSAPTLDINSSSFQTAASNIQDEYTDAMLQLSEAKTAEQQAVAEQNYNLLKQQVQNTFHFTLSNDAQAAWNQVQSIQSSSIENGTVNSGIYNEAVDNALTQQRRSQDYQRQQNQTQTQQEAMQYYTQYATPAEVNALTPEQKAEYGLTPSPQLQQYIQNLPSTYPNATPAELAAIKNTLIDPNGNMYSGMYQSLAGTQYSSYETKTANQQQAVENQALTSESQATAPYTASDNPYVKYDPSSTPNYQGVNSNPVTNPSTTPPQSSLSYTPPQTSQSSSSSYYSSGSSPSTTYNPVTGTGGLQMPSIGNSGNSSPKSSTPTAPTTPTFSSYVKTGNSPTVYGVTNNGDHVAFENVNQFTNSGGNFNNVQTVNSVPSSVNYSQYTTQNS